MLMGCGAVFGGSAKAGAMAANKARTVKAVSRGFIHTSPKTFEYQIRGCIHSNTNRPVKKFQARIKGFMFLNNRGAWSVGVTGQQSLENVGMVRKVVFDEFKKEGEKCQKRGKPDTGF